MPAPEYQPTTIEVALQAFVAAVIDELISPFDADIDVIFARQGKTSAPGAPYTEVELINITTDHHERVVDDATTTLTDYFDQSADLRIQCFGVEHKAMIQQVQFAYTREDLINTHLATLGIAWRGASGAAIDLTAVAGTYKEGRSEQSFRVGWRAVVANAGSAVLLAQIDVIVDGDTIIEDLDITIHT